MKVFQQQKPAEYFAVETVIPTVQNPQDRGDKNQQWSG